MRVSVGLSIVVRNVGSLRICSLMLFVVRAMQLVVRDTTQRLAFNNPYVASTRHDRTLADRHSGVVA